MNNDASVQNGTMEMINQDLGKFRVVETQGGLELKQYITDCERLINEFTDFAVKTAKSTLEMCRVVRDAKNALNKEEFLKFCEGIGHKTEDSTIRKYLIIGDNYERLINYADLLPNSWTSIYALTQLPPDVFQAHALTGTTMANMAGAQIKALMAPPASAVKPNSPRGKSASAPVQQQQPTAQSNAAAGRGVDHAGAAGATQSASNAPESADLACTSSESSASAPVDCEEDNQLLASSTSPSDQVFAKQAITKVIAGACASSDPGAVDAEKTFVPYEIVLRFSSKPTDAALHDLVDLILAVRARHGVDLSIVSSEPFAA